MRVFASCDSSYFHEHSQAWYFSALKQGYTPIIEVVNPDDAVKNTVKEKHWDNIYFIKVPNPSKSYLCSNRFHSAEKYLNDEGLLITDIDCYFNHPMTPPQEDVGLFFRLNNPDHMKIAAGIVWYSGSSNSISFARKVSSTIKILKDEWYVDQLALLYAFKELETKNSFFKFHQRHMDWEFQEGTFMWTGKGPRKYENKNYLHKKSTYEKETS